MNSWYLSWHRLTHWPDHSSIDFWNLWLDTLCAIPFSWLILIVPFLWHTEYRNINIHEMHLFFSPGEHPTFKPFFASLVYYNAACWYVYGQFQFMVFWSLWVLCDLLLNVSGPGWCICWSRATCCIWYYFSFFSVGIGFSRRLWIWPFLDKNRSAVLFKKFHVSLCKWPFINEPNGC